LWIETHKLINFRPVARQTCLFLEHALPIAADSSNRRDAQRSLGLA
jgi:hypothetical protein